MTNFDNILKTNLYGVMTTVSEEKPKTRVFQYLFTQLSQQIFPNRA